jgi:hypothetical protein
VNQLDEAGTPQLSYRWFGAWALVSAGLITGLLGALTIGIVPTGNAVPRRRRPPNVPTSACGPIPRTGPPDQRPPGRRSGLPGTT